MSYYKIIGQKPLEGEIRLSGSKNAALPILAATLLSDKRICISNVPDISDIKNLLACLSTLGKSMIQIEADTIQFESSPIQIIEVPAYYAQKIRGSIVLLGPLVARYEKVILPLPGGCDIGKRPIDQHIKAIQAFGVEVIEYEDRLECTRPKGTLSAANIHFSIKTVTGTENAIMAAVLAKGTSKITNAATEPEVMDLIRFLTSIGAMISWENEHDLKITGVGSLAGCDSFSIIGDRIEAGTFLVAAFMTKGSITLRGIDPGHLTSSLILLEAIGADIQCEMDAIHLCSNVKEKKPFQLITQPYPGFPTDLQSLFLSLATQLKGQSTIIETLFENRFQIAEELKKMGAFIEIDSNIAKITGETILRGAKVRATDLRSGAALVCAALAAEGESLVLDAQLILRGYESFAAKLRQLGARIEFVDTEEAIFAENIGLTLFSASSSSSNTSQSGTDLVPNL